MKRKLDEQATLNAQYQQALGQLSQARQTPPAQGDDLESQFDEPTRKYVNTTAEKIAQRIAEQTAYRMITRAQMTQELQSDPEIQQAANQEFNLINQNPLFSPMPQEAKEALAIANAKSRILQGRLDAAKKGSTAQALADAAAAQAAGATLPGTGGTPPPQGNKDQFIKEFIVDPQQRSFVKKMHKLDPDSPEGQAKLKSVAEYAWRGSPVSERFAQAVELLRKGGQ